MGYWRDMEEQLTERIWQMLEAANRHPDGLSYILLTPLGGLVQYYTTGKEVPECIGSEVIFAIDADRVDFTDFPERRVKNIIRISHRNMISAIRRKEKHA